MTEAATNDATRRDETGMNRSDTVLPPRDSTLVKQAEAFLAAHSRGAALIADNQRVDLPDEVFNVLTKVVDAMAQGKAVTVAPVSQQLTTSQAAEVLGISRQTLIRFYPAQQVLTKRRPLGWIIGLEFLYQLQFVRVQLQSFP